MPTKPKSVALTHKHHHRHKFQGREEQGHWVCRACPGLKVDQERASAHLHPELDRVCKNRSCVAGLSEVEGETLSVLQACSDHYRLKRGQGTEQTLGAHHWRNGKAVVHLWGKWQQQNQTQFISRLRGLHSPRSVLTKGISCQSTRSLHCGLL